MPKNSSKYLALLRGINVGGNNIIKKDDLKECFESVGFKSVKTYIQSGNILFQSTLSDTSKIQKALSKGLLKRFSYSGSVLIISEKDYKAMLSKTPKDWGTNENWKHNALFILDDSKPKDLLSELPPPKKDIETVTPVPGVIFWSLSKNDQTKTTLMELAKSPVYKKVTVRNHNTVFKLLKLFEEMEQQ